MQTKSTSQPKTPAPQVPSHVIERMESEWRQMRQGAQSPSAGSAK